MRISDWSSDVCSSDLLHLFDRGYAGIVLQEDGTANCCLAVHRSLLTEAGSPAALLDRLAARNPALGERLAWRGPAIIDAVANIRSEERRVGKGGVSRCRSRGSPAL